MVRKIGIVLTWLALVSYLIFVLRDTRPFEARTLVYPLAAVAALASYHLRAKRPVIWAAFALNVLALGSGLMVVTDMLRFTVHDVDSLISSLIGVVLFVLPAAFNVLSLVEVRQRNAVSSEQETSERKPSDKTTPASAPSTWYEKHLEAVRTFWERNQVESAYRKTFMLGELQTAIANGDDDRVYLLVDVALVLDDGRVDVLNEMVLTKAHRRHQEIVKQIQSLASPSSVPYLRRAFEDHLDYMADYNCSGTGVVAKWFSHALFCIGTQEALELLRAWSKHPDSEVRDEMLYRLSKLPARSKPIDTPRCSNTSAPSRS
jgi:hypothetical protein